MNDRPKPQRWLIVAGLFVVQAAAVVLVTAMWFATAVDSGPPLYSIELSRVLDALTDRGWWMVVGNGVLVFTALQVVFLWPIRKPAEPWGAPGSKGKSLWLSMSAAALMVAFLWTGLFLVLADILWLCEFDHPLDGDWPLGLALVGLPIAGWLVWTPLLVAFCAKGARETALGRLSARILLGTFVEAVAIIPLDVMVRRKTDCYCGQGTFWALSMCGTVGAFTLGPAVFLPILSRRRKRWYAGRCDACGYDMTAIPNAHCCPECGAGWRPVNQTGNQSS